MYNTYTDQSYIIHLFRGYVGNSQIIVPRWWRRSWKLAKGNSFPDLLPRDNGLTVPQVALKLLFYYPFFKSPKYCEQYADVRL